MKKCEFGSSTDSADRNRAEVAGGALFGERVNGQVVNTTFLENSAVQDGGGVFLWRMRSGNRIEFTNCAFWRNFTTSGASDAGGAMHLGDAGSSEGADARLVNCTFTQNSTVSCVYGTALYVSTHSSATVFNSIFYFNDYPGTSFCQGAPPIVGGATVSYSDVEGTWPGMGTENRNVNPFFVDYQTAFDLRLGQVSLCVDSAHYGTLPLDHLDVNGNGITNEILPIDLGGLTRMVDDPGAADQGAPAGAPWLDMGAYERQ